MAQKKSLLSLKIKVLCLTNKSPEFCVQLNQDELVNNNKQFFGYPTLGPNTLKVTFLNKNSTDTKTDSNGNILEDLAVIIESLSIDDIDITNDCKQYGIYTTQCQTVESTHGFLHKNGVFCYEFVWPIFYHLRTRHMIKKADN